MPELARRFRPRVIYGFDPNPDEVAPKINGVRIERSYAAAWTRGGHIRFRRRGTSSSVTQDDEDELVPCVDLAAFIHRLPNDEIVLKLDCEGSEYALLEHLHRLGVDRRLALVLVEWHGDPQTPRPLVSCPLEEW